MKKRFLSLFLLAAILGTGSISACLSNQDQVVDEPMGQDVTPEARDGPLLLNGDFSDGVSDWDVPYGRLVHSSEHFYSPPGGGILITNDTSGSLGFRANFGQCIDLRKFMEQATEITGDIKLVVEAAVKTDSKITEATLTGIFVDDNRCGTGHVGSFEPENLTGNQEYMIISSSAPVPDDAKSLHIFISALGADKTARLFIDEVRLYSPELDHSN